LVKRADVAIPILLVGTARVVKQFPPVVPIPRRLAAQ
jgi:hypothetical protein